MNRINLANKVILDILAKNFKKQPQIKSIEDTISHICQNNCSISRFGDGEFRLIFGLPQAFQSNDKNLSIRLKEILCSNSESHIIGLSDCFGSLKHYTNESKKFYMFFNAINRKDIYNLIDFNKIYYNTDISRPYMSFKDKSIAKNRFDNLKKIWKGRDVVIIEGAKSRLGVRNDLFSSAKSIKRILCPAEHAFKKYDEILSVSKKLDQSSLILIALGPTATVLAYDLNLCGYQAVDVGHIDIEYEWFLRGVTTKIKIENKYVNEAEGGRIVGNLNDKQYRAQVINTIY